MSALPDWLVWPLAVLIVAGLALYFWHTGTAIVGTMRRLVDLIQNWPQVRRGLAEQEAAAGGRAPLWLRALRVALVWAVIGLAILMIWRKLATP